MAGRGEGSGSVIKKLEETGVQMLKNKNKLLKKFGKPGLKAYRSITRKGVSFEELAEKSGLPAEQLSEIIEFMEKGGIAEVSGALPPREEKKVESKPIAAAPPEEAPPEKPMARVPPLSAPRPPLAPPPRAPEARRPAARAPGMIRPISDEEIGKEEKKALEEERAPPEEKEAPPPPAAQKPPKRPRGGISPIQFEEKAPTPPAPPPRAPEQPPEAPARPPPRAPPAPPREEEEFLTPSEKAIKDRYGETGLMVYSFIDGQRTAEQIMREAGVTEAQLIEMLDFMEKKGIIRLEHPERKRAPSPPPRAPPPRMAPPVAGSKPPMGAPPRLGKSPTAAQAPKSMFAPMVEEQPTLSGPITDKELASVSLDIPVKTTKGNILLEVQAKAQLIIKFGKSYSRAYEMIDGTKDVVDLSMAVKLPIYKIYDMLMFLQGMKAVMLKPAARDDIRKKYGEDGYSVYKKYGREGVLLYQLIGKEMSLKEMAALTTTDPSKVIDMFMFIHKLLGIELPIDEDVLRERLGIKKEEKPAA
ncbi:MAG: hypothetical protein PHQ80_01890 [Candidatus ainarchaeum sp.]|nr:hypothetical protein [Candidatus ainarchaeum sp.]